MKCTCVDPTQPCDWCQHRIGEAQSDRDWSGDIEFERYEGFVLGGVS